MEEVKKAAAYRYCGYLEKTFETAYNRVLAVAGDARRCYDAVVIEGLGDRDFVSMMFHDACFLLVTISSISAPEVCAPSSLYWPGAHTPAVVTDMFLLENQIPWLVLESVMAYRQVNLSLFIGTMGMNLQSRLDRQARPLDLGNYRPPHLLGLFHFYQSGHMINGEKNMKAPLFDCFPPDHSTIISVSSMIESAGRYPCLDVGPVVRRIDSLPLGTSASELAQIGVKLTPSKTAQFTDIGLTKSTFGRKLFLPPLRLNENTACWLLNMAAFETCAAARGSQIDCTVISYLALFSMLMHREEDVHELRVKHLIHGEFTNK